MATNGVAWAHGSTTHPARALRNMSGALMGLPWGSHANAVTPTTRAGAYGVVGSSDFLVTTTGSLGYSVAAGRLVAPGTFAAAQGLYAGYNDAAVTGSVTARHATLTRVDYIAYRVRDTDEDATGSEDDGIVLITGTAGSGAPSIPSSLGTLAILCEITVPSSAAGTPLTFTDRRMYASSLGAPILCTSATRPTGISLRYGTPIFETDTLRELLWDGSAWVILSEPPQTWTTGLSQPASVTHTTTFARYQRSRGFFTAVATLTLTAGGAGASTVGLATPVTLTNAEAIGGSFTVYDSGSTIYAGSVYPSGLTGGFYLQVSGNGVPFGGAPAVTLASGDIIRVAIFGWY